MSLLDGDSCECVKSELDLFNLPPTQTSVEETRFEKYYPLTSLDRGGPLEFKIVSSDREYIDPEYIFLYMQVRILDEDGEQLEAAGTGETKIPDDSVVFPVNYFHAACFKSIEVQLNGKSVCGNDTLYPFRAMLELLLSYNAASKIEHLRCAMFYKDVGDPEACDERVEKLKSTENRGATARFMRSQYSKCFETMGRLHGEIFSQGKLLLSKVNMNIKLQRADPSFALMAKTNTNRYVISIDKAILYVCHKKISDSVREAHELALLTKNAKYPVRKVQMKFFTRGANRNDLSEPNLVNGVLPRRVVFTLIDSGAFNGDLNKNPFNFQSFEVGHIALRKNGQPIPFEGIDLDYDEDLVLQGYLTLLHGTGRLFKNSDQSIDPFTDFKNGHAIYVFDLTPDHSDGNSFNLIEEGNISLDIQLKSPSTSGVTILTYIEYDGLISIDSTRSVYYE